MSSDAVVPDPFARPSRPPPPRTGQASASRHRRSLGQSIGEVVDHQIRTRNGGGGGGGANGEQQGGSNRKGSLSGAYQPSFGVGRTQRMLQQQQGGGARDLEDVNEALEARLRIKSNGNNNNNSSGNSEAGGLPEITPMRDLGSRPRQTGHQRGQRNSLIELGSSSSMLAGTPQVATAHHNNKAKGGTGLEEYQRGKRNSLGLSYGPITSSLDDQARRRAANNNVAAAEASARRGGGLGAGGMGLGSSGRGLGQGPPRRSSLHAPNGPSPVLANSIERSWQQQVEAATARAVARNTRTPHGSLLDQRPREDGYYHFPPGREGEGGRHPAAAANEPNSLALDNWFGAPSRSRAEEEAARRSPECDSGRSSRRNSGLAPLPDVDFDDDDEEDGYFGHGRQRSVDPSTSVELRDVDEVEQSSSSSSSAFYPSAVRSTMLLPRGGRPFSLELATSLKVLLFGSAARSFSPGWMGQAFSFSPSVRFGFRQVRGGPCGVLAAVQAHLVRALCFGAAPVDDTTRAVDPLSPTDAERGRALAAALAQVLARCAEGEGHEGGRLTFVLPSAKTHFTGVGRYRADGVTETLVIHEFSSVGEALNFTRENIGFFSSEGNHACIAFLYSCLLTRGIANVSGDMDSEDLPLMGAHGYCTQEMVNLMLSGRAVSNTFDGTTVLDGGEGGGGAVLRGIRRRCDVGLLSLFEHFMSCRVGEHLKTPRWPVWVVCSESHFSVLFSMEAGVEAASRADRGPIDLVYFDGLARQEEPVVLTVDTSRLAPRLAGGDGEDQDLVPPLEHCIRTKWRDAAVDWNGSEKIL